MSGRYLSLAEREEVAILRARGCGVREIARSIGRSPSPLSRELRRNAATRSGALEYRATTAQWHADRRAKRPKTAKLAANSQLRGYVQDRLAGAVERPDGIAVAGPEVRWGGRRHGRRADRRWGKAWSPEQIAHRLQVDFPDDESIRISHEAIYQALYVQGRGALRRELTACLRTGRALRVPRARRRARGKSFVTEEILISERPAEAEDRAVPGHWEGDLIIGGECRRNRVSVIERTGHAIYIHSSRSDFLFERGAERAPRASAGVPGTDVEIGGVSPVLDGNPTLKRQGRGPEFTGWSQCAVWRCGASVRAGLKEAIGASWWRMRVKRRKAFLGWVSRPAAVMPDSCRWVRGRSGDVITTKSQRFTQGDLLGSEVSVGRRTKGRRLMAQQKSEDRVVPEGGCNGR